MFNRNLILVTASALALTACGKQAVPAGAVVAFNLNSCPNSDWKVHESAQGRFIRGFQQGQQAILPVGKTTGGQVGNHFHNVSSTLNNKKNPTVEGHHAIAKPNKYISDEPDNVNTMTITNPVPVDPDNRIVEALEGQNLPPALTLLYCEYEPGSD